MTRATKRLRRGGVAAVATLATVGGMAFMAVGTANATSTATANRIQGTLRWDTAAAAAEAAFPNGATTVILASGSTGHYPDALAANYLAGVKGAPILLTSSTGDVPSSTTAALTKLGAKNVIIVGGTSAVPAAQATALTTAGYSVSRLDGSSSTVTNPGRYDTDEAIVKAGGTVGSINGEKTAIIATGTGFADALAAGPLAYAKNLPVIITDPNTLSGQAKDALTSLGIQQVIIVGGTTVVSDAVATAINGMGITTLQRFAGSDRSGTSDLLAEWEIANAGFVNTSFILASGDQSLGGVDALAGGPLGGVNNEPVLVTNTKTAAGGGVTTYAGAHAGTVTGYTVLGGTGAVSASIETGVTSAVQAPPVVGTLSVTPADAATVDASSGSAVRAYTASGLTDGTGYSIAVLPASSVSTSGGTTTFADSDGDNIADGTNSGSTTTAGYIQVVNGVAETSTLTLQTGVTPSSGSITFTIFSSGYADVVPVVFATGDGDGLTLTAPTSSNDNPKTATEAYGLGGETTFTPAGLKDSDDSTHTDLGSVVSVDTSDSSFVFDRTSGTDANNANGYYKVSYGQGGTFQYGGNTSSSSQFATALSAGDSVTLTGYQGTFGGSTFNVTADKPAAPSNVTAGTAGNLDNGGDAYDVNLSFTAPNPAQSLVSGYVATVYTSDSNGAQTTTNLTWTCAAPGSAGTTVTGQGGAASCTTAPNGTTLQLQDLPNGTYYATVSTESKTNTLSAESAPVKFTVQKGNVDTTKPTVTGLTLDETGGTTAFVIDSGDVITFTFSEDMNTNLGTDADGDSFLFADSSGDTWSVTCKSATNSTCSLSGTTLTVTVGGADPATVSTVGGGTPSPVSGSTVTQVAGPGWTDLAGNALDLSSSTDLTIN